MRDISKYENALKRLILIKKNIIRKQKIKINLLNRKVNYLNSPLRLFELTQVIQNEYDILLNPPFIKIKASDDRMSEAYKIKATGVVCINISTDVKMNKQIHLIKSRKNLKGDSKLSKLIKIHKGKKLKDLCAEIDSSQFHLVPISQSVAVNIAYYEIIKDHVYLNLRENSVKTIQKFKVSKDYIADFEAKKEAFDQIRIFHKTNIFSILNI